MKVYYNMIRKSNFTIASVECCLFLSGWQRNHDIATVAQSQPQNET